MMVEQASRNYSTPSKEYYLKIREDMEVANRVDGAIKAVMVKAAIIKEDTARAGITKEDITKEDMGKAVTTKEDITKEDSKEVGEDSRVATEDSKADGVTREDTDQ